MFSFEIEIVVIIDVDGEIWMTVHEVVGDLGLELLDIELAENRSERLIRVYIEKPEGILLSDCVAVSRALEECFDRENIIKNSYRLEVSSPGMERPLRRMRDFERYVGREVRMRLKGQRKKEKRRISGKLIGVDENIVQVLLRSGEKASFSLVDIAKANLEVDWEAEFQRAGGWG